MGQAKRNKQRLGEWYGRPIVPGHPDYVPPKKPERRALPRPVDRVVDDMTRKEPSEPTYLVTKQEDPSMNGVYVADLEGNLHRVETSKEEPMHPDVVRTLSGVEGEREGQEGSEERPDESFPAMRPKKRPMSKMAVLGVLGMVLASGIDPGPVPSPVRRTKIR